MKLFYFYRQNDYTLNFKFYVIQKRNKCTFMLKIHEYNKNLFVGHNRIEVKWTFYKHTKQQQQQQQLEMYRRRKREN